MKPHSFSLQSPGIRSSGPSSDMPEDPNLSREEERLLDLALGKGSLPAGDSELGSAARDLRSFVLDTREHLELFDSVSAQRLESAQSQISDACQDQVTEPGFMGGVVLRLDFFRACLKSNVALRIAAASLLLHLTALPVLAWLAFSEPAPRTINFHFEPPPVVLTEEPGEEDIEVSPVLDEEDLGDLDSDLDSVEK